MASVHLQTPVEYCDLRAGQTLYYRVLKYRHGLNPDHNQDAYDDAGNLLWTLIR